MAAAAAVRAWIVRTRGGAGRESRICSHHLGATVSSGGPEMEIGERGWLEEVASGVGLAMVA